MRNADQSPHGELEAARNPAREQRKPDDAGFRRDLQQVVVRVLVAVSPGELWCQEQRRIAIVLARADPEVRMCADDPEARHDELLSKSGGEVGGVCLDSPDGDGNDDEQRRHDPADQLRAARLRPFVRGRPTQRERQGDRGGRFSRSGGRHPETKRACAGGGEPQPAAAALLAHAHPEGEAQHEREVRAGGVDVSHVRRIPVADARFLKQDLVRSDAEPQQGAGCRGHDRREGHVPPAATSRAPDAGARARSRPW